MKSEDIPYEERDDALTDFIWDRAKDNQEANKIASYLDQNCIDLYAEGFEHGQEEIKAQSILTFIFNKLKSKSKKLLFFLPEDVWC